MSHPFPYSIKRHGTTLETCESEPVPTPGCIQAHGALLVLRPNDLTILQVSENSERWLGRPPGKLLGRPLAEVLSPARIAAVRAALARQPPDQASVYLDTLAVHEAGNAQPLQASLHATGGTVILELEPEAGGIEPDYYALLRQSTARFQSAAKMKELAGLIAEEVRRESGFDRVMVYFFHADESGEVIAESKRENLNSWLGWRYPAHDIPKPARDIFRKIWSRPVPDVHGELAEMVPLLNPDTGQPLDMTYCVLRGPSQMYTEYLANMGVGAAFTLPLLTSGGLWGLIACHHETARPISHGLRAAGEFLARAASQQVQLLEERETADYRSRLEAAHYALISRISTEPELSSFAQGEPNLLSALDAGGAALLEEGRWHTVGTCPAPAQLAALGDWLQQQPELTGDEPSLFVTDSLGTRFPPALDYAGPASGVMAFRFSAAPAGLVLWFRPEALQTFTWAGNPYELPTTSGPHGPRLTPRKSFEIWRETVRHRSLPWKKVEIEGALRLRSLFVNLVVSRGAQLDVLRKALELTRARFDISLDAAQLGAWELDLGTRKLWRTPRHDLIFGYDSVLPEWEFSRFVRHILPADRISFLPRIEAAFAAKEKFDLELRITDAKGHLRWIWAYGTPIQTGTRTTFVGLVGDITARKATEQMAQSQSSLRILRSAMALTLATGTQENETMNAWAQLLATYLERSAVLVWFADEAGVLRLRAIAGAFAGLHPEEIDAAGLARDPEPAVISAPGPGLAGPGMPASVRQAGFDSLATFPLHAEERVLGLIVICQRRQVSQPLGDEIRTMIDGMAQWVRRRAVERALAESSERARLAVEATNLGSWDYFPKTGVLLWSARCKELFGLPPEANVDYSLFLAGLHPEDRERTDLAVQRALDPAGNGNYDVEFRVIGLQDGGVERWVRSTGQAYFDADRTIHRFIGTVQDITEMVRARELLATRGQELQTLVNERTAELTATVGELEAFSYSISHDMRSPLRAMQGFAQALIEDYGDRLDDQGLDYLQRIDRGSKRLDLLIRDVLSYSRVAKSEIVMHPVALEPLLEEIIQSHDEFREPHATVTLDLAPVRVMAHEAFLSQIFSNLLGNAVKFQAPDSKPQIVVRSECVDGIVHVSVSDNGIGVDPGHHERIFRIFGRVHAEKTYPGTGIGLAIVRKAVERMSGEIGLESKPGRGTRFWFTLRSEA